MPVDQILEQIAAEAEAKTGSLSLFLDLLTDPTDIPEELWKLDHLTELELFFGRFATFPAGIGKLSNLKKLAFGANRLTKLPDDVFHNLTSIQILDLSNNELSSLPKNIGRLSALQELNIAGNNFTKLPDTFHNLTSLKSLNISFNRFHELPNSIFHMPSLSKLSIGGMPECFTSSHW